MGDREDIEILDGKIIRLKVEYEQYFARILKREPSKLRSDIEKSILSLNGRTINNTAAKFKLNSIVAKYNSYKQHWDRVLRAIEEGTYVRKAEGAPGQGIADAGCASPSTPPGPKGGSKSPAPAEGGFEDIYKRYIEARKECREPVEGITLESLKKTVEQYKKKVEEQYKTSNVDVRVYVKDGKAKLTIVPKK
ncbi:MAG: hypothetical protein H3C68_04730 [Deltaproteobacteria bacterium]|nr:hypothetical protein [Deltaproteobacteria bacterium]MBZ0220032.1 hypothetical protein [Deltaproteobacteria bacterium]